MRPHGSPTSLERRRHRAIRLLDRGLTPNEVALRVAVDPSSVRRWRQARRRRGEAGLDAKPHPGCRCRLSARQRIALLRRLRKGPRRGDSLTGRWTYPQIADLIERRYGVRYHVDHIPRLLAALGWPGRKPRRATSRRP